MTQSITMRVNGKEYTVNVPVQRLLLDCLRYDLGLTGTKEGCSVGVCGACSVLVDGELLSSCIYPAVYVDGRSVTSIEGVANGSELTEVQRAFIRHGGFQCGICTPGQILAATALLNEVPRPDEAEVRRWMMGNLCRCTGYAGIVEAILAASSQRSGPGAR